MKVFLNFLISCLCLVFGISCLSKIDFEQDRRQFVAVTGVISNNPNERTIKVFENIPTFGRITGKLYKNGEIEANLEFVEFRLLGIPEDVIIEPGSSYQIEIEMADGTIYQSDPQYVLPSYSPQFLSHEVSWQTFDTKEGKTENYGIDVTATIPVLPQEEPIYLRFQLSESWSFQEIDDPRVDGDTVHFCYIVRKPADFEPIFWYTNNLISGDSKVLLAKREVNQDFLRRHYFNIYTYRISKNAANYYSQVERLLNAQGLMIDEVPAPAVGNMRNIDTGNRIYGFIEFSLPDTSRIYVDGNALGIELEDLCLNDPCSEPAEDGTLPDCPCADCLLIRGATYKKPAYFE